MSGKPWGRIRQPTMLRLARAQRTQPVITGAAYASIISRAKPFATLGYQDRSEVEQWAADRGSCIPVDDYEVSAVSNATIAEEGFGGDKRNASKGVAHLLDAGVIDRASRGRRGHASLYVTFPTLADVAEGAYVAPPIEEPSAEGNPPDTNRAYACVRPNSIVENSNRAYDRTEKGVRQSEIGRTGVAADQGLQKHHQSNTADIYNRSGRSVAAAARAAPPARKRKPNWVPCPLCGSEAWRNTQSGRYECDGCRTSFPASEILQQQGQG